MGNNSLNYLYYSAQFLSFSFLVSFNYATLPALRSLPVSVTEPFFHNSNICLCVRTHNDCLRANLLRLFVYQFVPVYNLFVFIWSSSKKHISICLIMFGLWICLFPLVNRLAVFSGEILLFSLMNVAVNYDTVWGVLRTQFGISIYKAVR